MGRVADDRNGSSCSALMHAAARVVSNTRKFDGGLSRLLHDELSSTRSASLTAYNSSSPC